MDHETRLIRERLIELVDQGRLTDDPLAFDGEPLIGEASQDEYRPDGYSIETHKGCRRHRLIDERLAELAESNDRHEREVAETFPRWFCFDPREDYYPEMAAEDEDGAKMAREAFSNAMIRTYWLISGNSAREIILPADFVTGRYPDRVWHDECRVIFSNRDRVPERWPAQALEQMDEAVDRLRNPPPEWNRK